MKKRIVSLLLVLAMAVSLLPVTVWAKEDPLVQDIGEGSASSIEQSGETDNGVDEPPLTAEMDDTAGLMETGDENCSATATPEGANLFAAVGYIVTYDENGADGGVVPVDTSQYAQTDTVTIKPNSGGLTKLGFCFGGWMTNNIVYQPDDVFTIAESNVTFYAVWIPIYTFSYDGNGNTSGSVPVDSLQYPAGSYVIVADNSGALTKGHHIFLCWNTKMDGTGTDYYPNSLFNISTHNVTLYAKYGLVPVIVNQSVTYDANGATSGFVPTYSSPSTDLLNSYYVADNVGILHKPGYVFSTWNTKADGTGKDYDPNSVIYAPEYVTLYAKWLSLVTISYPISIQQFPTGTIVTLSDASNAGTPPANSVFMGWQDEKGVQYMPGDKVKANSNLTLTPIWETGEDSIYLVFDGNGHTSGEAPIKRKLSANESTDLPGPRTLKKSGYIFIGWVTDTNLRYSAGDVFQMNDKDTTLYAQWLPSYTVTYDKNLAPLAIGSGTVPIDYQSYLPGMEVTILSSADNLKADPLSFMYWNTKTDGSGTTYYPGDKFIIMENTTLYAIYGVPIIVLPPILPSVYCNVYYYINGTLSEPNSYQAGSTMRLPETGIQNTVWNTAADGSGMRYTPGSEMTVPENNGKLILYAVSDKKEEYVISVRNKAYVVSFSSMGSDGGIPPNHVYVITEDDNDGEYCSFTIPGPGSLYKKGYTFVGWRNSESGWVYKQRDTTYVSASVTLHPVWRIGPTYYQVKYFSGSTYGKDISNMPVDETFYEAGDVVTIKPGPTYQDKVFIGWNTNEDGSGIRFKSGSTYTFPSANIPLYPQFSWADVHKVTYNGNGAEGSPLPITYEYITGENVILNAQPSFSKGANYICIGWNTKSDGTGTNYPIGTSLAAKEDLTLYAMWEPYIPYVPEPISRKLTYNGNGNTSGTLPSDDVEYLPGVLVTLKGVGDLGKVGHSFYGWMINNTIYKPGAQFSMPERDVTAYAIWSEDGGAIKKKLAYRSEVHTGGTLPNETEYEVGKPVTLAENTGNLVKPGYQLICWSDGINQYPLGATVTLYSDTKTMYAIWQVGYTISYDGNGNTAGTVVIDTNMYDPGQTVTVRGNTGNLVKENHIFAGWFINGKLYAPGATLTIGTSNLVATAVWTPVNATPKLRTDVKSTATAIVTVGNAYTLNLAKVFEDKDGDALTYNVSIDGGAIVTVRAEYSYATTVAGQITLVFTANDGKVDSSDSYTVTLMVRTKTPDWSSDDGSSTGGGGSTTAPSTPSTPEKKPNQPVTGVAPIAAVTGANGLARANISDKSITDAIIKAQADAKKQGKTSNGIAVELSITMPMGATSFVATLTRNSLNSLVNAGVTSLRIKGSLVSISFDLKALQEIQKQSIGNISITISPATGLSNKAKALIGSRPVYNITISYVKDGKTITISSFGSGTATLSVHYTPSGSEAVGYLYGVYVDGAGKHNRIHDSAYDANSRSIIFCTNHLSIYGVGYTAPIAKFTDIGNHWAKEAIDFVVSRELLSGITETTFAPNTAMTRGMMVTTLGRLAGVDVKVYTTNSFTDVKADSTFRPYIEWASKKGIMEGTGNGKFEPDRAITREEIAVIFVNYAKATGYSLPVTREATTYADSSSIQSVYKSAVTTMQQAGIMMGKSYNKFNPTAIATRAEVSSMLHRYIKLTIDPATAQGWVKNDDGQYLYYKNGKALIMGFWDLFIGRFLTL